MSIFKSILAKIFPSDHDAEKPASDKVGEVPQPGGGTTTQSSAAESKHVPASAGAPGMAGTTGISDTGETPSTSGGMSAGSLGSAGGAVMGTGGGSSAGALGGAVPAAPGGPSTGVGSGTQSVDVEAVLSEMQAGHPETLNWRTSIVDLLKLLGLDSSLTSRKELATELGYTGNMEDSASMNIWLHKEVMRRFAENGGRVPSDLH